MLNKLVFYKEIKFKDIPELGIKIPEDWRIKRLVEICSKIRAGGTPKREVSEYWGGSIPFVKIEDITKSGKYLYKTEETITELGIKNSNAWMIPKNSLLLAMYGSLGEISINKIEVATNQAILGIIPNPNKIYLEYLYYWYLFFKPNWKKYAKPTTQANLTAEIVKNSLIPLPPLEEQKAIAEILSTIDKTIEKIQENIEKTEKLKKSLMQKLLTGEIIVKEENGKYIFYKEIKFKDIPELGIKIPEDWRIKRLDDNEISLNIRSGTTPSKRKESYWNGNILFVTISDMTKTNKYLIDTENKITELALKESKVLLIPEENILLSMYGTIGKVVINKKPVAISQNIAGIIVNKQYVDINYLFYALKYYSYQFDRAKIITLKHLDIKIVKNSLIPLPPLEEQKAIAEILSTIDKKIELLKQKKELLEIIKKWFMKKLLAGEIRAKYG
ncbi:restriction endonuclease subunit S [Nanoarchaeota archaeon]